MRGKFFQHFHAGKIDTHVSRVVFRAVAGDESRLPRLTFPSRYTKGPRDEIIQFHRITRNVLHSRDTSIKENYPRVRATTMTIFSFQLALTCRERLLRGNAIVKTGTMRATFVSTVFTRNIWDEVADERGYRSCVIHKFSPSPTRSARCNSKVTKMREIHFHQLALTAYVTLSDLRGVSKVTFSAFTAGRIILVY